MTHAHGRAGWIAIALACASALGGAGCSSSASSNDSSADSGHGQDDGDTANDGPTGQVDGSPLPNTPDASFDSTAPGDDGSSTLDSPASDDASDSSAIDAGDGSTAAGDDGGGGLPDGSVHPAYPVLAPDPSAGGAAGVVLHDPKLVTIVASNDASGSTWFAFDDALVASQWWKTVTAPYGVGTIQSNAKRTGPPITANMTYADIESYITDNAADAGTPDSNTIFLLYIPSGIWVVDTTDGVDNTDCAEFGGFHSYGSTNTALIYGIVQQCPQSSQLPGETIAQGTTHAASHEILEASTDPFPAPGYYGYTIDCSKSAPPACSPWAYAPGTGEVGDLCAWTAIAEGGYTYTRAWSNVATGSEDPCIPASPETVGYECAAPTQDWFPVTAGQSVPIPVHGWSSVALASSVKWETYSYLGLASPSTDAFAVTSSPLSNPSSSSLAAGEEYLTTDSSFDVVVNAPANAQSGDYAVVIIASYTSSEIHPWAVGVYVP